MSDALTYLMKARPEAMQSYFAFLKESGKHLDAKTRAIISVITKVDNQTPAGFRQYLKRALKEGVSANEIIDALLTAFPTLGLTKIIWAMDQLLEMQLPEFDLSELEFEANWHELCALSELEYGLNCLSVSGRDLLVYRVEEDKLYVYDARCPHQSTCIPGQALKSHSVTCPKHGWRFDLRSGECIAIGDKALVRVGHRLENDRLMVLC